MKHLLIVFHSQSGNNLSLALAVFQAAANHSFVETRLLDAYEAQSSDWLWADAFILICPENFAAISGGMKQFLDRMYYPCLDAQSNGEHQAKPYQLVLGTGNDGSQCELQLTRILTGLRAKPVQSSVFVFSPPTSKDLETMHELGEAFTEALAMGVF